MFIILQVVAAALVDSENIKACVLCLERFKLWFDIPDRLAIDRCEAFMSACRTVFSIEPTFDTWHNNQTFQGQLFSVLKGIKCTDKTADDFLEEAKSFVTRRFYDCAGDPHMQVKCKAGEYLNDCEYFILLS